MNAKGRILVIRGGAIGDFILTLPVFSALRGQFPNTRLEVLGYPHIAQLALAGRLVDEVQSIEARALAGFFARHGNLDARLAEYFADFSVIFSYLYDPDEIFKSNVARCSKAQFISGPHRPRETETMHATEVFLKPLERLAIFDPEPAPHLKIERPPDVEDCVSKNNRRCLALHPGSGSELKNWPEANWAELLQRLHDRTDARFALIGGEAEGERLQHLAARISPNRLTLAQSRSLVDVAGLLSRCDGFLGHDSGITHLAAALGLRGIALWGTSNEKIWRPLSPKFQLLKETNDRLENLGVERVFEAVHSLLAAT